MIRISNQTLVNNAVFNIDQEMANLAQTQEVLSTGKSVNQPSDNPSAFAQILSFLNEQNQNQAYQSNITSAQGLNQTTQSALQSLQNILQQAGSLYTEGENGALSAQDRQNIATQIGQLIQQAVGIGNTNFNGQYIFSGSNTQTVPFVYNGNSVTYQGNNAVLTLPVGNGENIQTNLPGSEALLGGSKPYGNIFQTLINIQQSFQNSQTSSLMGINNPPYTVNPAASINSQLGNFATPPIVNANLSFQIDGVTINYSTAAGGDSVNSIIAAINTNPSLSGVVKASFDPTTQQISIQSLNGKLIDLQDVPNSTSGITGNFTQFMQLQGNLTQIQAAQQLINNNEAIVGSLSNRLTQVQTSLQNQSSSFTQAISNLQAANVPQEITTLSLQQTALQAALQTSSIVLQQTNLFNFL